MSELSEKFFDALAYAARLHNGQVRKQTSIPYVAHLLAVASLVLEDGGTETEAIAALLHDAVEDQGGATTLAEIRTRYGAQVAGIVEAASDTDIMPKPPWRERKEAHLAHLKDASPELLRVVAGDKLHNVRCVLADHRNIGDAIWQRFNGGREGSLWYYRAVADVIRARLTTPLATQLDRAVGELEAECG